MKRRLIIPALVLTAGIVFAIGMIKPHTDTQSFQNEVVEVILIPEEPQPSRAEQVVKALAAAYPLRIEKAEFQNDDWAVLLDDTWYYYAEGRLLPEELLENVSDYGSVYFYNYQSGLPPWTEPSPEWANRLRDMNTVRPANPRRSSTYFLDDLWSSSNREEAWRQVTQVDFLGREVTVHSGIVRVLGRVEEKILEEAKTNTTVRQWIESLGTVDAWSWRDVASSGNRSYHAYGVAIDLLPRNLGGLETYWLWASQRTPEWWSIPYSRRYHPPEEVIRTFESFGFIWGGKWPNFDTMHFEYRPELFILSGLELERL
jgi:hypothetical protein